jgi:hypothetical protein
LGIGGQRGGQEGDEEEDKEKEKDREKEEQKNRHILVELKGIDITLPILYY